MAEVFEYLDPADYDEDDRIGVLYDNFLLNGAPEGVIVAKGVYQEDEDSPILPVTVDIMKLIENYIGGVKWNSDLAPANPAVKPREFYLSWGEVEFEQEADMHHDKGVTYAMAYSQTAFYYPAISQLRRVGEPISDAMQSYLAADIMHIYLGIHAEVVGNNRNKPGATDEEMARQLEKRMAEKFDNRFSYSILGTIYDNKVTTMTVELGRLGIPLVNRLNVMA